MLLLYCEGLSYAAYGSGNHRRHIHRPLVVLRAVLCAAIFTKCGCRLLLTVFADCIYVEVSSRATFSPHNDSIGCHVTLFDNEITQKRCRII